MFFHLGNFHFGARQTFTVLSFLFFQACPELCHNGVQLFRLGNYIKKQQREAAQTLDYYKAAIAIHFSSDPADLVLICYSFSGVPEFSSVA